MYHTLYVSLLLFCVASSRFHPWWSLAASTQNVVIVGRSYGCFLSSTKSFWKLTDERNPEIVWQHSIEMQVASNIFILFQTQSLENISIKTIILHLDALTVFTFNTVFPFKYQRTSLHPVVESSPNVRFYQASNKLVFRWTRYHNQSAVFTPAAFLGPVPINSIANIQVAFAILTPPAQ